MASMSILDDAIREHLELKRAHGADESELKKLEDEAFGPPQRPDEIDPFAEAPTEFMGIPETESKAPEPDEAGRRVPNITDLQEPPSPKSEAPAADAAIEAPESQAPAEPDAPADEEQPASEQPIPERAEADAEVEVPAEPEQADSGHSAQERHAIADQPTELFDVESVMESEPDAETEARSPSDEDLVDAEADGPRLSPVDPPAGIETSAGEVEAAEEPALDDEEDEDDFWSDQRLSDELNQALEPPVTDEHAVEESAPPAAEPTEESALPAPEPEAEQEDFEAEEHEPARPPEPEHKEHEDAEEHEDVLEDTPDFLEDAPEDDNLWFEQRPPKDFDFDD
ncbi:MAG TPA: hypothetical protein VGC49_11285 [Solirubrobacterales bacterium]|jgi:hypothetical protein